MTVTILQGDCREMLSTLPEKSVQCCVTSPPYFGLRDYGVDGQIGLEATPDAFVAQLVDVFRDVRRVLKDDGTLWLNLGDSYAANRGGTTPPAQTVAGGINGIGGTKERRGQKDGYNASRDAKAHGLKHKDLIGIPWRVAFALQADGWWLRQDIIWAKPNPMPESVRDRCTKAHEYIFLLSKAERYYFDGKAIAEPFADERMGASGAKALPYSVGSGRKDTLSNGVKPGLGVSPQSDLRNKRSVWTISTQPFSEAHFATFPPELPEICIKAGSRPGDTILDPFGGAGTTGLVADRLGRNAILCELNPQYAAMARRRIEGDAPLLAEVSAA